MNRFLTLLLAGAAGVAAAMAGTPDDATGGHGGLGERVRAHIEFLADDLLGGRQPGTPGYDIAAAYVASQFRQIGLAPGGPDGSYLQPVPLRRAWLEAGSAELALRRGDATRAFAFVDEFFTRPDLWHTETDLEAPLVFAGYGIDAPALEYSDYDGLDVAGSVVVILAGQPQSFPSEEGAHFASGSEKRRAALLRGAVGIVSIHTPRRDQRMNWDRIPSLVGMPAMQWLGADGTPHQDPPGFSMGVSVHHSAAAPFFESAPRSLAELLAADEAGQAVGAFPLDGTLRFAQRSRHDALTSPNVVGVLPGIDPMLNGEYLVYTAHLDHIGTLHGEGHADAINNGALDNASGTAVMMETARLLAAGKPPRRSVMFLAVTAEEKGLVGSEYFAHHPTVPIGRIVAAINLDMPVLLYPFGDVIAFGAEHSTLEGAARTAAEASGVSLSPDPFPEQNIFVRSDHYRFVQQGVPSIFLVTGTQSLDGTTDTQPIFEGFLAKHYHRPSDQADLPIDYGAAERFTRINARIGEIVANDPERPRWHEGDFFGETFAR